MPVFAHQFASAFLNTTGSSLQSSVSIGGILRPVFEAVCVSMRGLMDGERAERMVVPVVADRSGTQGVISRQYEAYVRDQRWTVGITEMRREEGHRGLREAQITGGSTTSTRASHCTQTYLVAFSHRL